MEQKAAKKIFSQIGLSTAILIIIQQVAAGIISVLINIFAPAIAKTGWYFWVLSYAPLYLIAFPIFLLMFRKIPDGSDVPKTGKKISPIQMAKLVVISIGIVYPLNLITVLISTLVEQLRGRGLTNPLSAVIEGSNPWVSVLFVVIIAPIMEEIIFRRLMYRKLIPFGGKVYVLFSAFIFALFHANVYQLAYAFILGALFAGITYYTGTIRYSIILHMIINFIGSGASVLLLAYSNETVLGIWSMIILLLMVIGIFLGIRWWMKHGKEIRFAPGEIALPNKKIMFLNGGMIFYMVLIGIIIVATLLM